MIVSITVRRSHYIVVIRYFVVVPSLELVRSASSFGNQGVHVLLPVGGYHIQSPTLVIRWPEPLTAEELRHREEEERHRKLRGDRAALPTLRWAPILAYETLVPNSQRLRSGKKGKPK